MLKLKEEGFETQKLTPRMTEQSHKKRFVVIYEIINRGVALEGNREVCSSSSAEFWAL